MLSGETVRLGAHRPREIKAEAQRDYARDIILRVEALRGDFNVEAISQIPYGEKKYPLFLISSQPIQNALPNVFLSAGIHGNEPAGVYGLLDFLKTQAAKYRGKVNLFAVPCVNPSGFENNTRETKGGVDVNRDFLSDHPALETDAVKKILQKVNREFVFALDMHEDPTDDVDPEDPDGYIPREVYFYESSMSRELSIGQSLIRAVTKEGVEFCKAPEIYGDQNDGGVIWGKWGEEIEGEENNTLQGYIEKYTRHTFTMETPTELPFEERKMIQVKMLCRMLDHFCSRL